ncbi:MAG TPA: hypothetical protein EYP73_06625 [Acidimicrobiia bacterium]|nr:hypothetical protein [Acidimicrobiia bacterium]
MFAHGRRLRWSGEHLGYPVQVEALANPTVDVGVPGGRQLIALVDAFFDPSGVDWEIARHGVLETLGDEAFVDAAAVFGNFEMMNRVAEGTGIPVPPQAVEREKQLVEVLGLYDILKRRHRPTP